MGRLRASPQDYVAILTFSAEPGADPLVTVLLSAPDCESVNPRSLRRCDARPPASLGKRARDFTFLECCREPNDSMDHAVTQETMMEGRRFT